MKTQKPQTDKIEKLLLNADIMMSDQAHLTSVRTADDVSTEQAEYADKIAQKIADVIGDLRNYKVRYEK